MALTAINKLIQFVTGEQKEVVQINLDDIQVDKVLNDGKELFDRVSVGDIGNIAGKYLIKSKNLFNVDTMILGKYLSNTSSTPLDNAVYNISDFIEVEELNNYVCNKRLRFVTYLDTNYSNVGGVDGQVSVGTVLTPPLNSKYMVATLYASDDLTDTQIEENHEITSFVPYEKDYPIIIKNLLNNIFPDSSVNLETLNFIETGKNKFNKTTGSDGYYMSIDGAKYPHSSYGYSDFIKVEEDTEYFSNSYLRFVTFFDSNKVPLSSIGWGYDINEVVPYNSSFTVPGGVSYMVVTYKIIDKNNVQIELGNEATEYEDYCYYFKDIPIREKSAADTAGVATIASIQYVCETKETNLYNENVLRNAKKYLGQTEIVLNIMETRWKSTSVSSKLLNVTGLENSTYTGTLKVVNENFINVLEKSFSFKVVNMTKNTAVTIANIGDSFSGRMTWANNILNEPIAQENLNFVGVRNANTAPIKCDAQGGYTITSWFTLDNANNLNQFMHPVNAYLYYGLTSFWIDANSATPSYGGGWFNDAKVLFDATTGIKLAPNINDVMNQGTKEVPDYIVWDGTSWVSIDLVTLGGFEFNYAKYRAAWDIPAIDILHILLGTNDFAGATVNNFDSLYSSFKTKYEALIASVHSDSPNCKIIVGVPVSRGKQGKYGTISTERGKLALWMLAERLHIDFANRENENIYLLDYHTQVDRVYGYASTQEVPFAEYDGNLVDDENLYKTDYVHLGQDGFDQMGNAYMAIIQELR